MFGDDGIVALTSTTCMEALTTDEIRQRYEECASSYDATLWAVEILLGVRELRRSLLSLAKGSVLDCAVGTGLNLPHFSRDCVVTGTDNSTAMLEHAAKRAAACRRNVRLLQGDVEHLEFTSQSFDTVVSSLALCTFADPVAALKEMSRVCRPEGRLLLIEHGLSSVRWVACVQKQLTNFFVERCGCHWDRQPLQLIREAGIDVASCRRTILGVFQAIVARPFK